MPARKSHLKERTTRTPAVIERAQALISDDPGQSLRKLASIVGVSEPTMRRKAICFSAERCTGSYESFDSKLALRQRRYVLVQGILASQQPRFKSLGLLRMERS
ncbi:hypothetical protein ALC60_09744 [Trachymyrmex zeteki]|uniref:Uncharacterized protein n=1 Tax=Mycetomoellerius zeteki TaxID=64791 RepID=A0A151WTK7_9HYME|nr:hypothetical protein ALC60_09744 [Trachymyrmex zeteki]